ncbi:DUF1798 family protein [Halobacillus sp. A5]|uniref:DUF1798 family protein n=1 Tax=Halobacillus sp. A5 TaxID=2880263 RepID=UPI0020A6887F|nr:DUF1798 family protein [Halobacillus sp. A5]MCP3025894.1 YppE family protein [Halobacillus sp. A5]
MKIQKLTLDVKELIDELHKKFMETEGPVDKNDHDFFHNVKKETKPLFDLTFMWLEAAESFVKNRGISVHPNQVKSTQENIEMLILHSYYLDIDKKRFKELHQSSHYVLDMILTDIDKQKEAGT